MINCHDSRGKVIVFLLLVIPSGLSISCNFKNDPISDTYMKRIKKLEENLPLNYPVIMPKIISKENEDQNCFHMSRLFQIKYALENIKRHEGSELDKNIDDVVREIHFVDKCLFKIPPTCINESVSISTILEILSASLAALKPNIESNFTHCLSVVCVRALENASTMTSAITTTRHNTSHQNSTVDMLSKEHTTPTVNLNDTSSDHLGGDHVGQSNGMRHLLIVPVFCIIVLFVALVIRRMNVQ